MKPGSDNWEAQLVSALREMAAETPREAPLAVAHALDAAFRRHRARRRAVRLAGVAATILAALGTIWLARRAASAGQPTSTSVVETRAPAAGKAPVANAPVANAPAASGNALAATRRGALRVRHSQRNDPGVAHPAESVPAELPRDFVVLSSVDPEVRDEDLRVVRLELTGRAMRLAGVPVTEEMAERRVLADFVVGQDGTPYAVRFVPRKHGLE